MTDHLTLLNENATTDRRAFLGAVGVATALALVGRIRVANAAVAPRARNVVLVHGLYADGSSWANVIGPLLDAGLHVTSVQNPLTTLAESVAATRRALAMQQGPTVLAGHSWSGTIVSEVGGDPNVSALVYVAARAPDAGEDFVALAKTFPSAPASAGVVTTDGFAAERSCLPQRFRQRCRACHGTPAVRGTGLQRGDAHEREDERRRLAS